MMSDVFAQNSLDHCGIYGTSNIGSCDGRRFARGGVIAAIAALILRKQCRQRRQKQCHNLCSIMAKVCCKMSEQMPNGMPDRRSERMQDGLPEAVAV